MHQDGLVHISQLADRYVKDPHQVVKVQQKVMVTVLDVDLARRRISLSMKANRPTSEKGNMEKERKEMKKTGRKEKPESTFSNNPFAVAFGKKK